MQEVSDILLMKWNWLKRILPNFFSNSFSLQREIIYRILFWRQQREDTRNWSVGYSTFLCDYCSSDWCHGLENFSGTG